MQQTRDGGYLLGGASASSISGDKTQASQGGNDFWLVKLQAAPLATTPVSVSHQSLTFYPNPSRNQLTLLGPLGAPYQLLTPLGQVVRSGRVSAQPLDVQGLPAGLYLLRDTLSGRTSKLLKE